MTDTIYASFADADMAEKAVGALLDHGVRNEDITLVSNEQYARTRYGYSDAAWTEDEDEEHEADPVAAAKTGISTTSGADAASGAAKGAGIGLGLGVIGALATMFVPGFGLVAGGGALASALGAAAATTAAGAAVGGTVGYLKDQGVPENVAMDYDRALRSGGALVAVRTPSGSATEAEIQQILAKYNAGNVGGYGMAE